MSSACFPLAPIPLRGPPKDPPGSPTAVSVQVREALNTRPELSEDQALARSSAEAHRIVFRVRGGGIVKIRHPLLVCGSHGGGRWQALSESGTAVSGLRHNSSQDYAFVRVPRRLH